MTDKPIDITKEIQKSKQRKKINKGELTLKDVFLDWMAKDDGPTPSEAARITVNAFLGRESGEAIIGDVWKGFKVATAANGTRIVLKVKENLECSIAGKDWLPSRIGYIMHRMVENGLHPRFIFSANQTIDIAKTIINESTDVDMDKIAPVHFAADEGLCWKRLDFDPEPGETPYYNLVMNNIETDDQIFSFEAMAGALFDPDAQPQNVCVKYGDAGSGKSTIDRFLYKLFEGSHGVVPSRKIDDQWVGSMIGKRLGTGGDNANFDILKNDVIKSVSGNDPVMAKILYAQPFPTFLRCLLFISSNEWPRVEDDATRRRILPVSFHKRQEGEIGDLDDLIWDERRYIIARWVEAWERVKTTMGGKIPADISTVDTLQSDTFEPLAEKFWNLFNPVAGGWEPVAIVWNVLGIDSESDEKIRRRMTRWLKSQNIEKSKQKINKVARWGFTSIKRKSIAPEK